jgi:hypothetical protein
LGGVALNIQLAWRARRTKADSVSRFIATCRKFSWASFALLSVLTILIAGCAERDDVAPTVDEAITTVIVVNPVVTAVQSTPTVTTAATVIVPASTVEPKPTSTSLPASTPTVAATPATVVSETVAPTSTAVSATAIPPPTSTAIATSSPTPPTIAPAPPEPTAVPEQVLDTELAEVGSGIYASNCTGCHSKGMDRIIGPGHANVFETAKTRVEGLSPEDYLSQSIREPKAFVVPGFSPVMPSFSFLSNDQILALIEFLKTL